MAGQQDVRAILVQQIEDVAQPGIGAVLAGTVERVMDRRRVQRVGSVRSWFSIQVYCSDTPAERHRRVQHQHFPAAALNA